MPRRCRALLVFGASVTINGLPITWIELAFDHYCHVNVTGVLGAFAIATNHCADAILNKRVAEITDGIPKSSWKAFLPLRPSNEIVKANAAPREAAT